jgi:ankyrin repeat protein
VKINDTAACAYVCKAKQQSSSVRRSIHDAVKAGDVKELETMVKDGASVNEIDSTRDRFTPLHWACYSGSLEVSYSFVLKFIQLNSFQFNVFGGTIYA